MKNLGIIFLILGLLLASCQDDSISKRDREAAKQEKEEVAETPVETPLVQIIVEKTPVVEEVEPEPISYYKASNDYTPTNTIPTYWYVWLLEVKQDAEGKVTSRVDWHWCIKLDVPYFDFVEAMRELPPQLTGKVYFKTMKQVSRESYDSWREFKRIYHDK